MAVCDTDDASVDVAEDVPDEVAEADCEVVALLETLDDAEIDADVDPVLDPVDDTALKTFFCLSVHAFAYQAVSQTCVSDFVSPPFPLARKDRPSRALRFHAASGSE